MPNDFAEFQRRQLAFTAHVRDPENRPRPADIPERRMSIYVELIFNNINEQLRSNFPVLHEITDADHWRRLVRDFMIHHRSETPLFTEVALEFIGYVQQEREPAADDWPFMLELAHYEYVELAVSISTAGEVAQGFDPNGDLLQGKPMLASTAWPLSYQWPVHRIGPDYLPDSRPAEPTHLVVYRDRHDDVRFLEVNPVSRRLLQLLQEHPALTGLDLMTMIAEELGHDDPAIVLQGGTELLAELRERGVIIGTRMH